MNTSELLPEVDVIEGVYLCTRLDLPELFSAAMAEKKGLRLYRPEDVPDPARIRFALVWAPAEDAFDAYPNVELVQVIAAGVDGVLHNPSLPENAVVTRVHDPEQAATMAGFAVWHVVWHHRKMGTYLKAQQDANWSRYLIKTLKSPSLITVGILGYGLMGKAIAQATAALGFQVLVASRTAGESEAGITRISGDDAVNEVAAQADILINVLPLTPQTRNVLNAKLFAIMPKGAALIQLGRGDHLVEEDLIAALDSGQIGGASLDVFKQEPLPDTHPFWTHPNVVVTPHEASVTTPEVVANALENAINDVAAGRCPTSIVDLKTGY
ncbi:MAG: glyoxylate/hydroxypyruvate reductase A [Sulfitobacter sp.]